MEGTRLADIADYFDNSISIPKASIEYMEWLCSKTNTESTKHGSSERLDE